MLTVHCSAPGCSGGAAGGSNQDPNKLRQPWLSLMMMSSLTIHTRIYLLRLSSLFLSFQDRISKGSTRVTFYQQRGHCIVRNLLPKVRCDVRPGYTGASPWDFPLDRQGHLALKLPSGVQPIPHTLGLY